ncbi:MAG: GTP-binding protein HSR1, partial [Actinobacteria bacterium]|nr:GTP-binding protein HSR1 [Actinomycetota bacterium]
LLLGGLLLGPLTAAAAYRVAAVAAARRKSAARRSLAANVTELARERVIAPAERELETYRSFCRALARARGVS